MSTTLPDPFLHDIAARLSRVPGVEAIVLGGSRARGTHRPDSDIDLGIYYVDAEQFDLLALDRLAQELDDRGQAGLVTGIGGWGPWVNGGGWLTVQGWHVDLLYRDLARVERIVDDCHAGRYEVGYQGGHPHGFPSYLYMGEVAVCRPLWDRAGRLEALKLRTRPYPPALRRAIVNGFFWEAGFSLDIAGKAAGRADVAYVAGCGFRCVMCLTQCLFAANGEYWLNEKGSVAQAAGFQIAPADYTDRVAAAFAQLGSGPSGLSLALADLRILVSETDALLEPAKE